MSFELKCLKLETYKPIVMEPISTDTRLVNGQSVMVKVYPMGYATTPRHSRVATISYIKSFNGRIKEAKNAD